MAEPAHVAIVGGGIAGLAAAHWLERHQANCRVTLIERAAQPGGKIATDRVDGFVIEGGPDAFLARKPRGLGLCREIGIEDELVGSIPEHRRSFIVRDGELCRMPEGLSGLIPAQLEPILESPLLSDEGKARFALEPEIPPSTGEDDESLEQFVERRFGHEIFSRLIEPLMAGIYAGRGDELSLAATFPHLRALEREHGSVLRGIRESLTPASGAPSPGFLTPKTGMDRIVSALVKSLSRTRLALGTGATRVHRNRNGFIVDLADGARLEAGSVILATPAYITANLIEALDQDLAERLAEIPFVSTATVSLAFRAQDVDNPLNGYGYIIPRRERTPVLACTWVSRKYPCRAPEGYVLIRGFVGRRGEDEAVHRSDEELQDLVLTELRDRLHITRPPHLVRIFRWPNAMPQYTLGHLDRLAAIEGRLLQYPGLFIAGNAYRGVGIPDCIASGESAAQAVALGSPAVRNAP